MEKTMPDTRVYHADVEVRIRYHDAVYAENEFLAGDKMRRAVETLFEHLEPITLDVEVLSVRQAPEPEDDGDFR